MANFMNKLTPLGRFCVIALGVVILGLGLFFGGKATGVIASDGSINASNAKYDATVVVNTYCGFEPIVWGNGGLEPADDSYFAKNFNVKLKIIIQDDFDACRAALKNGSAQMAYCTLDALPVEMGASGTMTDMRYFMLLNFSNGADAIVVNKNINTIADLRGKKIAYAEGTASHTLLINALETAGLRFSDITPIKVGSGIDAMNAFKALQVDAAVVWAPDDEDCVDAVKGAKVLVSTAQASALVSDGLIAKQEWLQKNEKTATKIMSAILWANSEIQFNQSAFNEGAKAFAKAFNTDVDFAKASSSKIAYATLEDQKNWFGLSATYDGMTAEVIYTKMAKTYSKLGLCEDVLAFDDVSYKGILKSVIASKENLTNKQTASATRPKEFTAPTVAQETAAAMSNKKVTINFPVNGCTLDNEARSIIDQEFVTIAKEFANTRIRVEGNTDNTGNYDANVALSKRRAQAVVDYLVSEHNMPKNRFIVVGNGPKHAIADNVSGSSEAYRTTDFQLISE